MALEVYFSISKTAIELAVVGLLVWGSVYLADEMVSKYNDTPNLYPTEG